MCAPVFYITGQSIAQLYSVSIMGFSICATLYVANDYPAAFSGVVGYVCYHDHVWFCWHCAIAIQVQYSR